MLGTFPKAFSQMAISQVAFSQVAIFLNVQLPKRQFHSHRRSAWPLGPSARHCAWPRLQPSLPQKA